MTEFVLPVEAEIVHELPEELAALIGHIMVGYAKLEHKLTMMAGLILQLNKAEVRVALRMPRASERLEMIFDLFAIKDIYPNVDGVALAEAVTKATSNRDLLAHSLWLQHPESGQLYLRMTRGAWPKDLTRGERVTRAIYPQSIPYDATTCREALKHLATTLEGVERLGAELDVALLSSPEKFREPAPVLNPLGRRGPKG